MTALHKFAIAFQAFWMVAFAYVGAWLKIISYIGAGAYLANAMAGYLIALSGNRIDAQRFRLPLARRRLQIPRVLRVVTRRMRRHWQRKNACERGI